MSLFDTSTSGLSYLADDDDEDRPRYSYQQLAPGHPLLSGTPMGGLATGDVGEYYGGTVPGAEGFDEVGGFEMAYQGLKEGFFAPIAGLAERIGLLEEGTRLGIREEFERKRQSYLSEDPGLFRTTYAGLMELAPSAIPYAPVGTVGKLASTVAPRLAKYGLQGTRLADPKVLARGLAAGGGAAIGLGETAGGTPLETAFGIGLGAGAGHLAGKLDIPDGGLVDRFFKEEGIVDEALGPASGFRPDVEQARRSAAYSAAAKEQEAIFELNVAKAHADEQGLSMDGNDYEFIANALTDPKQMDALMQIYPDDIGPAVMRARDILDEQSRRLVEPGGKVYDNYKIKAERAIDEPFEGFSPVSAEEVMRVIDEDIAQRVADDSFEDLRRILPESWAEAYQTGILKHKILNNQGEYMTRAYQAFIDPDYANNRFKIVDSIRAGGEVDIDPADAKRIENAYDFLIDDIRTDKHGQPLAHYMGPEGEERARVKLFKMLDRGTMNAGAWGKGKLPRTDWGPLKARTLGESKTDRAIRTMLGEDEDAFRGMQRTIKKVTASQEAYEFKKTLRNDLLESGQATEEIIPGKSYEVTQLSEAGLPPIYVDNPKLAAELGELSGGLDGGILDAVNFLSKAMATVMNPVTHVRNIMANPTFLVYGGVNPLDVIRPTNIKEARTMLRALDGDPSKALTRFTRDELDEMKEGVFAMMSRGMLENVDTTDLTRWAEGLQQRSAMRGGKATIAERVGNVTDKLTQSKFLGNPAKKYAYEDYFFKNMGYQSRKRQWAESGAGFTDAQVKELTLHDLERMLPTYSRRSKVTEKFRKAQFIAPFVNFYSELVRTAKQSLEMASKQMMDPEGFLEEVLGIARGSASPAQVSAVRKMGQKRMAGIAAVAATPVVLERASKAWLGISKEEEEATREFMAPWDRKAPVMYLDKEPGNFSFVNLGYLFPHAALTSPSELAGPFTSPAIPVSEAFEAYKDLSRAQELGLDEKAKIVGKHGFRALAPGFLKWGERVAKGAAGVGEDNPLNRYFPNENRYGKQYSLTKELAAPLGRPTEQDVVKGLRFKATSYSRGVRQAKDLVNATKNQHPDRTIAAIGNATGEHEKMARRFIDQIDKARILGSTDKEIEAMLKDLGTIPQADVKLLMKGLVPAFRAPKWSQ